MNYLPTISGNPCLFKECRENGEWQHDRWLDISCRCNGNVRGDYCDKLPSCEPGTNDVDPCECDYFPALRCLFKCASRSWYDGKECATFEVHHTILCCAFIIICGFICMGYWHRYKRENRSGPPRPQMTVRGVQLSPTSLLIG